MTPSMETKAPTIIFRMGHSPCLNLGRTDRSIESAAQADGEDETEETGGSQKSEARAELGAGAPCDVGTLLPLKWGRIVDEVKVPGILRVDRQGHEVSRVQRGPQNEPRRVVLDSAVLSAEQHSRRNVDRRLPGEPSPVARPNAQPRRRIGDQGISAEPNRAALGDVLHPAQIERDR